MNVAAALTIAALSPEACRTTETVSVAAPSAARSYRRLSGTKNDVEKFGIRIPRGAAGERWSVKPVDARLWLHFDHRHRAILAR
jgi:hypothetical protein